MRVTTDAEPRIGAGVVDEDDGSVYTVTSGDSRLVVTDDRKDDVMVVVGSDAILWVDAWAGGITE